MENLIAYERGSHAARVLAQSMKGRNPTFLNISDLCLLTFPVDQEKTNLKRPFISRPVTGQIQGETSLGYKIKLISTSISGYKKS